MYYENYEFKLKKLERKRIKLQSYFKLIISSIIISFTCSAIALLLKHSTDFFEHQIFNTVCSFNSLLFILLPTIGITSIFFLRKYIFRNRKNKGIAEIYNTIDERKDHLPFYKIPSHFINGFLTVVFGGSTGIEVSTVVATAAIGNTTYKKEFSAKMYKKELVCAGITAGVAILFANPLAGWLFAMEVIARKINKTLIISCTSSALAAWLLLLFFHEPKLLSYTITKWNFSAIPFFILLSVLGALLSVYFTFLVIRIKFLFSKISNNFIKVNTGALLIGMMIFCFPSLYGDSYHALKEILGDVVNNKAMPILLLFMLSLLKPLAASLTLGAGGDGGVFAPSIVAGAFLGLMVATFFNSYFNMHLIPLNFAMVGAAATLSASLYAPYTSLILICGLLPNGNVLFLPVLMSCIIAQMFSKRILPYNVYTYDKYVTSKT